MTLGLILSLLGACLRRRLNPSAFVGRGFTLIELLIGVAIIAILAAIGIPMLQDAQRKASYARAATDTKTAVTQAIIYANDRNAYPRTLLVLRNSGYSNVQTRDPWNNNYRVSSVFSNQSVPDPGTEAWVCSQGPRGGGSCPASTSRANTLSGFPNTGKNGSVGYSVIYGGWIGN